MSGIEIKVDPELEKLLSELSDVRTIQGVVEDNVESLSDKVRDNAEFRGHYNSSGAWVEPTGATKRSVGYNMDGSRLSGNVTVGTEYAPFLEFGTRRMASQPFIRPSMTFQVNEFKRDLEKMIKK